MCIETLFFETYQHILMFKKLTNYKLLRVHVAKDYYSKRECIHCTKNEEILNGKLHF